MRTRTIYFPGLNGLRAIAALAVVISHTTLSLKEFNLDPYIFGALANGKPQGLSLAGYGVTIFFVLSGFLITYLLQAEKDLHPIDIKKFYLRRLLRIWPLYYLYLSIAVLIIFVFNLGFNLKLFFLYTFFAANVPYFLMSGLPLLFHYWSLGVEEQFYLIWPWINKKFDRYLIPFILVLIGVLLGTKLALHYFRPGTIMESALQVTRFHCMMLGGIGAILYKSGNRLFIKLTNNKISQALAWTLLLTIGMNQFHVSPVWADEIVAIIGLILIIGQIKEKNRIINLEVNVFDFLGRISYGIYVIHPLLIFLFAEVMRPLSISTPLKYIAVYGTILGSTILIAYLSYEYFERIFMQIKSRFIVVPSAATKKALTIEMINEKIA